MLKSAARAALPKPAYAALAKYKARLSRTFRGQKARPASPVKTYDLVPWLPVMSLNTDIETWNDWDYLAKASDSVLRLDWEGYDRDHLEQLDRLVAQTSNFSDPEFSTHDLNAWCHIVCRVAGHFFASNKVFLDKTGVLFDTPLYVEKYADLVQRGILELELRNPKQVNSPLAFAQYCRDQDIKGRRDLANTIAYLGRYSYGYGYNKEYEHAFFPILRARYDLSLWVASQAMLPIFRSDSVILKHLNTCCSEMKDFFSAGIESAFAPFAEDFFGRIHIIRQTLVATISALSNISRHKDVIAILDQLKLNPQRLCENGLMLISSASLIEEYDDYEEIISTVKNYRLRRAEPYVAEEIMLSRFLIRMGRVDEARELLKKLQEVKNPTFGNISAIARAIEGVVPENDQVEILSWAQKKLVRMGKSKRQFGNENFITRSIDIQRMNREVRVFEEYNSAVSTLLEMGLAKSTESRSTALDDMPKNMVVFGLLQDRVTATLITPLFPTLQKNGAAIYSLIDDSSINAIVRPWPFSPRLTAKFESLEGAEDTPHKLMNNWIVRPDVAEISCDGINYYQGFFERIGRIFRVYSLDWSLDHVQFILNMCLRQADRLLTTLKEMEAVVRPRGGHVTLVSLQSHYAPFFIMKLFAQEHSETFSHVTISSSYENWASNVAGNPVSTLTFLNNTKNPSPSFPAFGRAAHFEKWLETEYQKNKEHYDEITRSMTSVPRAGSSSAAAQELFDWISSRRKADPKINVFCALGKIPYDLGVNYQGGPAHSDIKDWLNHTVDTAAASKNILLVKPHPHELNIAISHKPNEGFLDMISRERLPDNIRLLPHRGISLQDLVPYVDHFLCWNGSSIPELGSQGVSILAADDWAGRNYPINVALPQDRKTYAAMLQGQAAITMHTDFQSKSAGYVAYMVTAPFCLPNPYVGRSSTNTDFNRAWINWDNFTKDQLNNVLKYEPQIVEAFLPRQNS